MTAALVGFALACLALGALWLVGTRVVSVLSLRAHVPPAVLKAPSVARTQIACWPSARAGWKFASDRGSRLVHGASAPNCPLSLRPVQRTVASASSTQVVYGPAETSVAVKTPYITTGELTFASLRFPSAPAWLSPQQRTLVSERIAHSWSPSGPQPPPASRVAVEIPLTATGVG
ncbi:MAG: hypothetical protein WCJ30_09190 [Deltaproteobacteria bacterium]